MEKSLIQWILDKKEIEVYAFYDELPIRVKLELHDIDYEKQQIIWSFNEKLKLPLTKSKEIYFQYGDTVYTLVAIIYNNKELITSFPTPAVEPKLKRRHVRVRTTEENPVFVEIKGKKLRVLDISEKGIGLLVDDIDDLKPNEIYDLKLEIKGKIHSLKGKIVYITEVEEGLFRIGIQFTDISSKVEDDIFKYILERQKEVIKKISMFAD